MAAEGPMSFVAWAGYFEPDGRILHEYHIRKQIFHHVRSSGPAPWD